MAETTSSKALNDGQNRRRNNENLIIFWLDTDVINLKSVTQLRQIINSVYTFDDADECINYLTDIDKERIFFILSENLCKKIVPLIDYLSQIKYIYILGLKYQQDEQWTKQYHKIRGLHEDISSVCNQMKQDARQCLNSLISMSVIASIAESEQNNNQQEASFMYSRLLNEIFIDMETTEQEVNALKKLFYPRAYTFQLNESKMELCEFFREEYHGNNADLVVIDEFERDYSSDRAIWWYTRECFLYRLLNKALRIQDSEILYKLRFFIKDLHLQIKQLSSKFTFNSSMITLYRGQGMLNNEFERLRQNIGGLLSIHSFWSTSLNPEVPSLLVPSNEPDAQGILFQILIDRQARDTTSFANIESISHFQTEKEILFSMGSVFRILSVSKNTTDTWVVCIKLTDEEDTQLKTLREHMTKQIGGTKMGEYNLAKLLQLMGKYDEQERFYQIMLSDLSLFDDMPHVLAIIYNDLAGIFKQRRDFTNALNYYQKSLEIDEKYLPPNDQTFANLYNNIGSVYSNQDDLDQSLVFLEKSLKINRQQIAATYNNIAEAYRKKGDHENALQYHKMAFDTVTNNLPSNHPFFSTTYSNMGGSYYQQGRL
jgi:tetratricopeptide (TPR) repeat protein